MIIYYKLEKKQKKIGLNNKFKKNKLRYVNEYRNDWDMENGS